MRVIVHDFSGHPFQAELSRQLASNGNEVEHVFSGQYESGKGHLAVGPDDAAGLSFRGITLDMPFEKYSPISRLKFERAYAKAWIKQLKESAPVDKGPHSPGLHDRAKEGRTHLCLRDSAGSEGATGWRHPDGR